GDAVVGNSSAARRFHHGPPRGLARAPGGPAQTARVGAGPTHGRVRRRPVRAGLFCHVQPCPAGRSHAGGAVCDERGGARRVLAVDVWAAIPTHNRTVGAHPSTLVARRETLMAPDDRPHRVGQPWRLGTWKL